MIDHLQPVIDYAFCNAIDHPIMQALASIAAFDLFDDGANIARTSRILRIRPIILLVQHITQSIVGTG
ncbi:hypothetical protein [Ochrobactrum sp. C6C9]|uniref:hypothetical protein n=1 Tax=Ochrobactrum sp. C6C9 TaxID=2736662 RepID=UPI003530076A